MHITITLNGFKNIKLPIHYNHILQGIIYDTIDAKLAEFLHGRGYFSGKRNFKMFSYSNLYGKYELNRQDNSIIFCNEINWTITSPVLQFCESIANGLLLKGEIRLNNSFTEVEKVDVQQLTVTGEQVKLKTLSPVVVYSTLYRADGRKYTCYYQPGEPDYDLLVENNLRKKYQALYECDAPTGNVKVQKMGQMKMHVINYKNTIIKGYSGKVNLSGPKELLQMAVDGGMGSKNGQGFGCVTII